MEQKIILKWSELLQLTQGEISKLDEKPGVFRISKKNTDGKFYIVFVGSGDNLKSSLQEIQSGKIGNELLTLILAQEGQFAFKYAEVEDVNIRKAVEKQMYNHYAPIGNQGVEPESILDIRANLS